MREKNRLFCMRLRNLGRTRFLLFSVVQTGPYLTENKKQMNWSESFNHCKLSTLKNVKDLNITNVWLGGLYLQTPWMAHRGCFYNTGTLDIPPQPYSHSQFDWNITSACSYKCRKNKFFALKAESCVCLNSLSMMEVKKMENCILVCNGSKKDPCGAGRFFTIYEQHDTYATDFENSHKVERGTTYNRRPVIQWIINETLAEISNETANFHNIKCVLLNENLRYVPMSCNLTFSALCEYGSEKELTTVTNAINMETSLSTSPLKKTVLSGISTTASPGSRQPVFGMTTNVAELTTVTNAINMETSLSTSPLKKTVLSGISTTASPGSRQPVFGMTTNVAVVTVVGALIAIVVILLLYKRKRKRIIYHSRNSASNDLHASLEGEQTMQMFSSNDRSRNRTNTVPFILQQKQPPGNISVSNYQDPVDMENQYQRLDFSMRGDLKEVHDDYAMQFYNRTSAPAVNDDDSKPLKKAGLTKGTKDLKEVYNNYCLPYDALSLPPAVNKDDMKIQTKVRPSVTMKDEKHNNVAYCDTAIVHEDFLYDIPKHSSKSLDNR